MNTPMRAPDLAVVSEIMPTTPAIIATMTDGQPTW